jgi:hypothetical protein
MRPVSLLGDSRTMVWRRGALIKGRPIGSLSATLSIGAGTRSGWGWVIRKVKHCTAVREDAMTFLPSVVQTEHKGGFRLRVVFNDSTENTIDFAQWMDGPMFEALKAPEFFARYFIDGGLPPHVWLCVKRQTLRIIHDVTRR